MWEDCGSEWAQGVVGDNEEDIQGNGHEIDYRKRPYVKSTDIQVMLNNRMVFFYIFGRETETAWRNLLSIGW